MTNHFDTFDIEDEHPKYIRDYYVDRKAKYLHDSFMLMLAMDGKTTIAPVGKEFGCGNGEVASAMIAKGYCVIGTDISPRMIEKAKTTTGHLFFVDDVLSPKIDLFYFDFAYCVCLLHHLEDQRLAIHNMAKCLKPGGLLMIVELNAHGNAWFRFYMEKISRIFHRADIGKEKWLDPDILVRIPGLRYIGANYFTMTPDWCPRWLLPLFKRLDRWIETKPRINRRAVHVIYTLRKV